MQHYQNILYTFAKAVVEFLSVLCDPFNIGIPSGFQGHGVLPMPTVV